MDKDDRADVASLQTVRRNRLGENHSVMFLYHGRSLIQRMGGYESGIASAVRDYPDGPNHGGASVGATDLRIHDVLDAEAALHDIRNSASQRLATKRFRELLPALDKEPAG